jgi:hypothetical protein
VESAIAEATCKHQRNRAERGGRREKVCARVIVGWPRIHASLAFGNLVSHYHTRDHATRIYKIIESHIVTIALYRRYQQALKSTPHTGRFMPYDWSLLPRPLDPRWIAYAFMLDEFSIGLANTINDLTYHEQSLRAWATVVESLSDVQKLAALHEFINASAIVAVNLPYVIRARFAFAVTHLCHQANRLKSSTWRDELPADGDIDLNVAHERGRGWRKYRRLRPCLEKISGQDYREGTRNFRNVYTHRLEPRFVIGISQMVTREVLHDKRVQYRFGGQDPLNLNDVTGQLKVQRDRCYKAFDAFQILVREHEAAIAMS